MNYNCDHGLFMAMNFDGGPWMDQVMLTISGTPMWLPLYVLIVWLVWRQAGWRHVLLLVACLGIAIGLSDIISGIFKHTGLLKNLWASFPPRPRPMFEPLLEGLTITPDSLSSLRHGAQAHANWMIHVPREALGGLYGTVSAHAATVVSLATLTIPVIRRRWFTWLMIVSTVLICYSRVYLAKHYPIDLALGTAVGLLTGWCMYRLYLVVGAKIKS